MTTMTEGSSSLPNSGRLRPGLVWPLFFVGLLLALVFWKPLYGWVSHVGPADKQVSAESVQLLETPKYSFLRQADFLGNHFVMLRHTHTSQRIILLLGEPGAGKSLNSLYQQPLTAFHFQVLMQVFQSQSSFADKTLKVTEATVEKTAVLKAPNFRLPYKVYEVKTQVNGDPQVFEAYVGKIMRHHQNYGLVMTFNSKNAVAMEALTDLLEVLKAQKYPKDL